MRCGGGGTHWWTKAHIAYVGVVGLLTSNLDDHQLEEGRSELGVTKTFVFVFVFAYVGQTNKMNDLHPRAGRKVTSGQLGVTINLGHCCHHFGGRCRPPPPFTYQVSPKILEFTFFASDGCGETSSRLQRLLMTPMSRPRLSQEALMMVNNGNPQILGLALFIRLPSTKMFSGPNFWFKANQILWWEIKSFQLYSSNSPQLAHSSIRLKL